MDADSQTDVPRVPTPRQPVGVLGELANVLSFARETLSQFLELASIEGRRAGLTLVWMLAGGLVATIFIVAAWAGLMAALGMYVVSLGLVPMVAVILVAALNLIAGAGIIYWCIRLSRHLLFTATRRQLAGASMVTSTAS